MRLFKSALTPRCFVIEALSLQTMVLGAKDRKVNQSRGQAVRRKLLTQG